LDLPTLSAVVEACDLAIEVVPIDAATATGEARLRELPASRSCSDIITVCSRFFHRAAPLVGLLHQDFKPDLTF